MAALGILVVTQLALGPKLQAAGVDDFNITRFDVQMTLGRDEANHSTLKTVETITANFPLSDQNHGLERKLVGTYNKHTTGLKIESVTDSAGQNLRYSVIGKDILRIGDPNKYVHGEQTYVITYSQKDVTRFYQDTGKDEFYWDVIGVEWRVPISNINISLTLDDKLAEAKQTEVLCYQGATGSNQRCDVSGQASSFVARAESLASRQGMTVAVGFAPGTFVGYQKSQAEKLLGNLLAFVGISNFTIGPLALLVGLPFMFARANKFKKSDPMVQKIQALPTITEFLPPKDRSVLESSEVLNNSHKGNKVAAQIIDWAVRHYIEIRQTGQKSLFKSAKYELKIIKNFDSLSPYEQTLANDIFAAGSLIAGTTVNSEDFSKSATKIMSSLSSIGKEIKNGDLYDLNLPAKQWFKKAAIVMALLGVLLLNIPLLVLSAAGLIMMSLTKYPSGKGEELKHYLEGLKQYIQVAETERLKMLQSPEGAEKVGSINNSGALIKLYERVLPYAVLFGQEKQWSQELGKLYEDAGVQPTWSPGMTAFNAGAFSGLVDGVSSTVASSYSASSGGSGGGGFSGGGGGGGGGGGW